MKVGIVGAGVAGLACADRLRDSAIETVLFDKGRRPGGRLSTLSLDGLAWDFGAQYIKPDDGAFAAQVTAWRQAGLVAPWPGGPEGALVPVPTMSALTAAQCAGHDVRFGAQVLRIAGGPSVWHLCGPDLDEGPFAALAIAIPSQQAAPLLSLHDLPMAREAAAARSQPCWAVMVAFAEPLSGLSDYIEQRGAIAWAARDNSKPGRDKSECWVIHADADWSQSHLEASREVVAALLMALFAAEAGRPLPTLTFLKAHRWRFARPYGQHEHTLWNPQLRLGACGDWCMSGQIGGAWRAGTDLADRIAAELLGETAPDGRTIDAA